jgi:hypothetical protein
MMRGWWDHQQPLSPATIQSAVGVFTWMVVALVALNVLGALGTLFEGKPFAALVRLLSGTGIPFAIWLVVRCITDLLILQNRTVEQMTRLAEHLARQDRADTTTPGADRS